MTFRIELPRTIDAILATDIERQSVYASPYVVSLRVTGDGTAVEVESESERAEGEVRTKIERYLEAMLAGDRTGTTEVFLRNERHDPERLATGVYAELKRRGWLLESACGQVALAGPALALARAIDAALEKGYRTRFGAVDVAYPAFIEADVLARCGYLRSHPHRVSMVTHLVDDPDAVEAFRRANAAGGELRIPGAGLLAPPRLCLVPSADLPCYRSLEGQSVPEGGRALTWLGRCFRNDSDGVSGLERLCEFSVRELVLVGTAEFVAESRRRLLPLLADLVAGWDLDCRVESPRESPSGVEEPDETVWEVRLTVEPGTAGEARAVAAGSIKSHGDLYGRRFAIRTADGQPAFTASVSCGIERWVLAAFTQHGFDPARWPVALRAEMFV